MTRQTGYLRTSQDEALIALDKLNRRIAAIEAAFAADGGNIAAVITEAAPGNMGVVPPLPGFTEALRRITRAHGALLISDEVMTGFRCSRAGWYGLEGPYAEGAPDLFTCGIATIIQSVGFWKVGVRLPLIQGVTFTAVSPIIAIGLAAGGGTQGLPEIYGSIIVAGLATFFVAPYLLRTNEHIRVDLVVSRLDPASARRVECGVLAIIMAISLITGVIGTMIMIKHYQGGTMVFKALIFPPWWLDWIIPLSSLAMRQQALEMLIDLIRTPPALVHAPTEGVPGIRPDELP